LGLPGDDVPDRDVDPVVAKGLRRFATIAVVAGAVSIWAPSTAGHAATGVHTGTPHAAGHLFGVSLASWELAYTLSRWVTYSAVLLAAGGALFLTAIHDRKAAERRLLAVVVTTAALVGVVGTVAGVFLHTIEVAGIGGAAARDLALMMALLPSPDGIASLVRIGGLAVLLLAVPALLSGRRGGAALVAGGGVAVLSFALAGHTMTAEPRWLALVADACHTIAASMWFGGLVLLGIVLHRRTDSSDPVAGARMVARFSAWATGAVLVVAIAGLTLAWVEVRTLRALVVAPYGWTLAVKTVIVAAVLMVGAYNNRLLVPAIRRAAPADWGPAWRRLRWTVRIEVIGLVAALAATAVLVDRNPPRPHVDEPVEHAGVVEVQYMRLGEEMWR
jgi:copper transport protein